MYAHRVYLERGDSEVAFVELEGQFGKGGKWPGNGSQQWLLGVDNRDRLMDLRLDHLTGIFYGFRLAEDATMFFLKYSKSKR